ncbi:FHA domain-containing protein, partial [Streptomyces sp. NPDC004752]
MQIRLTVVDPLGPSPQRGRAASREVLVTAPVGTALAAVTSALASAVAGDGGAGRDAAAPVVLYAGAERLDARRCTLGEPPLVDGAVLALGAPAEPEPHPELDDAPTQLHVVAGPDAGGVHLLHGGRVTVGRSADADVPLDDPDVSRLHCAVTVAADGGVSVADLGSTNGTALDGVRVAERPVRFAPGALLRIGESALRLTPSGGPRALMRTAPDGEGCVRVTPRTGEASDAGYAEYAEDTAYAGTIGYAGDGERAAAPGSGQRAPSGPARHVYGTAGWDAPGTASAAQEHRGVEPPVVSRQGGAPRIESRGGAWQAHGAGPEAGGRDTHAGRFGAGGPGTAFGGPGRAGTEPGTRAGGPPTPRTTAHGTEADGAAPGPHVRGGHTDPHARGGHTEDTDTGTPGTRPRGHHTADGPAGSYGPGGGPGVGCADQTQHLRERRATLR